MLVSTVKEDSDVFSTCFPTLTKTIGLSAGTAVSFGVDATAPPYQNENAAYFALATTSWPIMFFIAWKYTNATNYLMEDGVIVPIHVRDELGVVKGEEVDADPEKEGDGGTAVKEA